MIKLRHATALCALVWAALQAESASYGQSSERVLANPPVAARIGGTYEFLMRMVPGKLYNPKTRTDDQVLLRNYVTSAAPPGLRPIGPTIETRPGEKIALTLTNRLPGPAGCKPDNHNVPKCFDITNFHTHGFWVSPSGNSDNVLLTFDTDAPPFKFEFDVPPEHPAGTFWYHPHVHGSTAIQLASGLEGAIIIRGNRLPQVDAHGVIEKTGDIDTLFAGVHDLKERIMLFQQISYGCRDGTNFSYTCQPGQVGQLYDYKQIGPGAWSGSGRFTSINGQVMPDVHDVAAGRLERWRLIDAGIGNTINFFMREEKPNAASPEGLSAAQAGDWVAQNCTGEVVHQFDYASDGLTRSKIDERAGDRPTILQPGYREDVLVAFPHPGRYCIIDTAAPAGESISQQPESRQLLGIAVVGPGENIAPGKQAEHVRNRLVAAAAPMPPAVRNRVVFDLNARDGMLLTAFVPHPSLVDEANVGEQTLAFNMPNGTFAIGKNLNGSDAIPYNGKIVRTLWLDTTDQWILSSASGGHPYHVHVNPFQIVKICDSMQDPCNDVSGQGEPSKNDFQYAGLRHQWRDTIFVKPNYRVYIRTHYARFDGVFVLHCHILNHEDQGMMEKIQICRKGGKCEPEGAAGPDDMKM
ncbi:MAG: multicopper oxidase domain-containing protein [Alphaproteobacteria bacterium]|nr:multicopper oxidase domain-containing protein [Alphaproteobacteria bacterium]